MEGFRYDNVNGRMWSFETNVNKTIKHRVTNLKCQSLYFSVTAYSFQNIAKNVIQKRECEF